MATETVAFKIVFYSVGDVGASVLRVKKKSVAMRRKALKMHWIFSVARMWETARCFKDALQDIFADDLHAFEDASQDILADDLHAFKDTSQDILADDLDGEEDEYDEDRRANDFHAVFHHEAGADVVTDHVADGAWDA